MEFESKVQNLSARALMRKAQPYEAARLSALAFRSKAYWGYDDAFMEACRKELALSPGEVLNNPTYVIEENKRILGFYKLEPVDSETTELGYLFVEPEAIGKSYGGKLMEHAKATAIDMGYRFMIIQGDPNAAGFYEAFGGKLVGSRPSDSIPGRELPLFKIRL